jgi:hypothetical protein
MTLRAAAAETIRESKNCGHAIAARSPEALPKERQEGKTYDVGLGSGSIRDTSPATAPRRREVTASSGSPRSAFPALLINYPNATTSEFASAKRRGRGFPAARASAG